MPSIKACDANFILLKGCLNQQRIGENNISKIFDTIPPLNKRGTRTAR
ncbi:MAG: hypothetical protein ACTSWN_02535 [Promethearchaeota archaeon]